MKLTKDTIIAFIVAFILGFMVFNGEKQTLDVGVTKSAGKFMPLNGDENPLNGNAYALGSDDYMDKAMAFVDAENIEEAFVKLQEKSYTSIITMGEKGSAVITSEEIIVICTMIRILVGTLLRTSETARLDMVVTKITAMHITSVVDMLMVTARAEQIPRTCSAMGWLLKMGSIKTSFCDAMIYPCATPLILSFWMYGPKPNSPLQKLTRFSTPRVVKVAPERASTS